MPASSAEARARWRKRKRDYSAARKSKLKESDNDEIFDDNEDDDDPELDPPQNHLETEDDPQNNTVDRANQIFNEKESEVLVDGGLRISEFPIVIKRLVNRPHSSVLGIVEAERAARNGQNRGQMQVVLENISYGQVQAISGVPRDSTALLVGLTGESASGSCVILLPRIMSGSGVTKRFGTAGRIHVVPVHSEWFSPTSVHRLERQVVPHFFSEKSSENTPEKYIEARNIIVAKYMENPQKHLSVSNCQGLVSDINNDDLTRIVRFLDHWGIINYCAAPLKHDENRIFMCEESNSELRVASAALKSIDSLIEFDKPKCRLKAEDVYTHFASNCDKDFESTIREQLSENECGYCLRSIPTVYYQSQKEADVMLCSDCFHEGRFVAGHSSLDFSRVNSMNDYRDVDGDNWTDQETLLLLEGIQLYNDNWNKIAEHIGSKSKPQCILHFVHLPLDCAPLGNVDVPSICGSSNLSNHNHERTESNSNGLSVQGDDSNSKIRFTNMGNPVMNLVAFLASALGPRVAAACAHASLSSLSKDAAKEGEISNSKKNGTRSQNEGEAVSLSPENVKAAAEDGLAAAALKAKLFADHEEREIQRLSANIINHQLKRLELKLKQFAEVETVLMRECEQMEMARQRIASDRAHMMSARLGSASTNTQENNRQHSSVSQQSFISGNGNINNQPVYPHMSLMQQHGIYSQRLSGVQESSSPSNSIFTPASNSQLALGHQMLRPVTGTKSGFG